MLSKIEEAQPLLEEVLAEAGTQPDADESLRELADLDVDDISLQNDIMGRLEVAEKKKRLRNFVASLYRFVRDDPHKAAGAVVLIEKTQKYGAIIARILGFPI